MAPPADPALADPFFGELRRWHPDVDIVMLPPEPLHDPGLPAATPGQCRATQRHLATVLATLADRVGREITPGASGWWRMQHPLVHRWVARALVADLTPEERAPVLRAVGDSLAALGWDARPPGRMRLRGTVGPLEVVARRRRRLRRPGCHQRAAPRATGRDGRGGGQRGRQLMTLYVYLENLRQAAEVWDGQADALRGASTSLADADVALLGERVAPVAERFLGFWVAEIDAMRRQTEDNATALSETADDVFLTDQSVVEQMSHLLPWDQRDATPGSGTGLP